MSFSPDDTVPVVLLADGSWTVIEPREYIGGQGDAIKIPVGFRTDFASVPWVMRAIFNVVGKGARAALVHDVLCVAQRRAFDEGRTPEISSIDTDGLFRRVLGELGVWDTLRWLYWAGVRWGALLNPARRAGWWRTAHLVIPISVLAAPIVVPVAAITFVGAAALAVVEGVAEIAKQVRR